MIKYRQKEFTEYDAMRSLYVELMKRTRNDRRKFPVIDATSLIPILRGNNIVIERFVISTSLFGKDKFRMYLKIGAKAKMPDEVRLTGYYKSEPLGKLSLNVKNGLFAGKQPANNGGGGGGSQPQQKNNSDTSYQRMKLFSGGGNKPKGPSPYISAEFNPYINITKEVHKLLGEAIKYDKKSRSLVLEFDSIDDAIDALDILPFGIDYKIYLLGL